MEEYNNIVPIALDRYFTKLLESGNSDTDNIVIITAISYILDAFKHYLKDEDLRAISKVIYCISGNCLIDFPSSISEDSLFHSIKNPIENITLKQCNCNNRYDTLFSNLYCR